MQSLLSYFTSTCWAPIAIVFGCSTSPDSISLQINPTQLQFLSQSLTDLKSPKAIESKLIKESLAIENLKTKIPTAQKQVDEKGRVVEFESWTKPRGPSEFDDFDRYIISKKGKKAFKKPDLQKNFTLEPIKDDIETASRNK